MSSLRKYATIAQVQEFADITSTDDTEFEDRISQSEELIDAYIGHSQKFLQNPVFGNVTGTSPDGKTIYDNSGQTQLQVGNNYYSYCYIDIIAGTGAGQKRFISASNLGNKSITVDTAWDTIPDTTSRYRIYQLGLFPRQQETFFDATDVTYYKAIPDAVMRAVCAQMAFLVQQGDEYFANDGLELNSESIGNYSYSKAGADLNNQRSSTVRLVAPRARALLRGYKNSTGTLSVENTTCL